MVIPGLTPCLPVFDSCIIRFDRATSRVGIGVGSGPGGIPSHAQC